MVCGASRNKAIPSCSGISHSIQVLFYQFYFPMFNVYPLRSKNPEILPSEKYKTIQKIVGKVIFIFEAPTIFSEFYHYLLNTNLKLIKCRR